MVVSLPSKVASLTYLCLESMGGRGWVVGWVVVREEVAMVGWTGSLSGCIVGFKSRSLAIGLWATALRVYGRAKWLLELEAACKWSKTSSRWCQELAQGKRRICCVRNS